uniref:Uncharacterized protein n=1 Tax=Arundo donax TaxID=35708 RepID=A0A0A8YKE6_ARUDO
MVTRACIRGIAFLYSHYVNFFGFEHLYCT